MFILLCAEKTGGFRPIVNLKPLNRFIKYEHFKMDGLETVRILVKKGDWFIKLNLKDAYFTVGESGVIWTGFVFLV